MKIDFTAITNPISLCAYVLLAVFAFLAKHWRSKINNPLFYFMVFISFAALIGGIVLAWHQASLSQEHLTPPRLEVSPNPGSVSSGSGPAAGEIGGSSMEQKSTGTESPNVISTGSGNVSVQIGNTPRQPSTSQADRPK